MIKLKTLLESLDYPYKYSHKFKTELIDYEDEENGETYKKDILQPVQIISFKTDDGTPYIWYARQNRYDDTMWEIAFGIDQGQDTKGSHKLNIDLTGASQNVMRIFSTIIDITNSFIEYDENYEIRRLIINSKGDKRTKVYITKLLPKIQKFRVESVSKSGEDTEIIMQRYD